MPSLPFAPHLREFLRLVAHSAPMHPTLSLHYFFPFFVPCVSVSQIRFPFSKKCVFSLFLLSPPSVVRRLMTHSHTLPTHKTHKTTTKKDPFLGLPRLLRERNSKKNLFCFLFTSPLLMTGVGCRSLFRPSFFKKS